MKPNAIALKHTNAAQILQLRHQVLRHGHAIAEVMFAEDQDASSRHYGAFNEAGVSTAVCLCCPPTGKGCHPGDFGQWQLPRATVIGALEQSCFNLRSVSWIGRRTQADLVQFTSEFNGVLQAFWFCGGIKAICLWQCRTIDHNGAIGIGAIAILQGFQRYADLGHFEPLSR